MSNQRCCSWADQRGTFAVPEENKAMAVHVPQCFEEEGKKNKPKTGFKKCMSCIPAAN